MKTVDLIPLILFELNDNDKYGLEITTNIEKKTNNQVVIKQPTLYTLLKKLEKSKFISSYWLDSDIGGKRHYYSITNNGRLQLSTLPSYNDYLKLNFDTNTSEASENSASNNVENIEIVAQQPIKPAFVDSQEEDEVVAKVDEKITANYKPVSIFDELVSETNEPTPSPRESVVDTKEMFKNDNIDEKTSFDINQENINLIKSEDNTFIGNTNVSAFTKSTMSSLNINSAIDSSKLTTESAFELPTDININDISDIKSVEYSDFTQEPNYIQAKNLSKKYILRSICSAGYMLIALILNAIITRFSGRTPLYYTVMLLGVLYALFYPMLTLLNSENLKMEIQEGRYTYNYLRHLIISFVIFFLAVILSCVVSINTGFNSISSFFGIHNYANLYATIIDFAVLPINILLVRIFTKKG